MFDKYIGAERMNTFARVMILSYFFNHASVNLPFWFGWKMVNCTVLLLQLQLLLLLLLLPPLPPHFSRPESIRTNVELSSPSLTGILITPSTPLHVRKHSYTGLEIWWYYRQPFPWINFWLIPASILVGKVNKSKRQMRDLREYSGRG